ncbi:unnamed protein product [Notodromas monacha]|uniref:DUF3456 domain-containing protein n=1 Tax=Notodromas monacha TaxID=399045 RepID=A0A7R9GBQ2_9CRUS|nr:unnamed protein product [Notodromas monacha]CAG0915293.1 unnamed protein product [Notodromas monacha]
MRIQVLLLFVPLLLEAEGDEVDSVKLPTRCETCKILSLELQKKLEETGKSHDVIETGYGFEDSKKKKRTKYRTSELRLLESLENVCNSMLEYNLHKERADSTRFAKGMSQTFQTLHGLVGRGVKVDLGIPEDLWDKPPVEVTALKTQCEKLLEDHEDDISDWYYNLQDSISLQKYLCSEKALKNDEDVCLTEEFDPESSSRDEL